MCGIAGGIVRPRSQMTKATLERMLHAIEHRGPDGHGTAEYQAASGHRVLLGHRRLAIIDPVGGHQPMVDDAAQLALTFNGEIYNFRELREELKVCGYRFERDSDTEVLLRAYQHWGEKAVEKLRGMFAFAIWDGRNQKLFMARDRFGEKPLFLLEDAEGLHFASEIKALLQLPREKPDVNLTAVWDFLSYRYVPGPRTLFRGIRKLPPASCLTWENGKLTERRYWVAPDSQQQLESQRRQAQKDAVHAFLDRLDQSVKMQMVSDVPFGAFLSGGIDSSTIVALMQEVLDHADTIVIGNGSAEFREVPRLLGAGQSIVDLVRIAETRSVEGVYDGICW